MTKKKTDKTENPDEKQPDETKQKPKTRQVVSIVTIHRGYIGHLSQNRLVAAGEYAVNDEIFSNYPELLGFLTTHQMASMRDIPV